MANHVIDTDAWHPGQIWTKKTQHIQNGAAETRMLIIQNTGDRPIQVGSHYHFFEVNRALSFERERAWGMRLAIPAGTARRFEPGMEYEIELIEIGGERVIFGCNGLCSGILDDISRKEHAVSLAHQRGFKSTV